MSKKLSCKAMSLMAVSHTAHDAISWNALWDYIAELEAAQRWIPVSERLPEDEKTVIVAINDVLEHTNEVARLTYLGNGNWWSWKSERYIVTHWMPLPESPEVQA